MKLNFRRLGQVTTVGLAAVALSAASMLAGTTATAAPAPVSAHDVAHEVVVAAPGDGTPAGAIEWFEGHLGSSGWEHYCEKAVENAYGTTGVWASAIAHWNGAVNAGKAHPGSTDAPKGAFVYWNISQYGHVGISDGNGGFYSTGISGAIGHRDSLGYFSNYLGWSNAQVPA